MSITKSSKRLLTLVMALVMVFSLFAGVLPAPIVHASGEYISVSLAPTLPEDAKYATTNTPTEIQWKKVCKTSVTISAQFTADTELPVNSVKIIVPKAYWENQASASMASVKFGELSVAHFEQDTSSTDPDNYVLTNNAPIANGAGVAITIPYDITPSGVTTLPAQQLNFSVKLVINGAETTSSPVTIGYTPSLLDDGVLSKYYRQKYEKWDDTWGATEPTAYPESDYFYVRWEIMDNGQFASEMYDIEYNDTPADGGVIVAWRNQKDIDGSNNPIWYNIEDNGSFNSATVGKTYNPINGQGINSEHIVVAYDRDAVVASADHTVHNTAGTEIEGRFSHNTKTVTSNEAQYIYTDASFAYYGDTFRTNKDARSAPDMSMVDISNNAETRTYYEVGSSSFGLSGLFAKYLAAGNTPEVDDEGRYIITQEMIDALSAYHFTTQLIDDMLFLKNTQLGVGDYDIPAVTLNGYYEFDLKVSDSKPEGGSTEDLGYLIDWRQVWGDHPDSALWYGQFFRYETGLPDEFPGIKLFISKSDPKSGTLPVWEYYGTFNGTPDKIVNANSEFIFTYASDGHTETVPYGSYSDQDDWVQLPDGVLQVKFEHETDDYVDFSAAVGIALKPSANVKNNILGGEFGAGEQLTNISTMVVVPNATGTYESGNFADFDFECSMKGTTDDIKPVIKAHDINLYSEYFPMASANHECETGTVTPNEAVIAHHATDKKDISAPNPKAGMDKSVADGSSVTKYGSYFSRKVTLSAYAGVGRDELGETGIPADVLTEQRIGVFYDLLPEYTSVNENTIYAYTQKKTSGESNCSFDVEQIRNWRNSGCTMLKITVYAPDGEENFYRDYLTWKSGFNVTYELNIPFDLHRIKATDTNYAAYFGQGNLGAGAVYDDASGTGFSDAINALLNDLNNDGNPTAGEINNTVYDSDTVIFDPSYSVSTLTISDKKVSVGGGTYKGSAEVHKDEYYTYSIGVNADMIADTTNLVFYDVLDSDTGSQWKGILEKVETLPLLTKDLAPVVYYSTKALDMSLATSRDLTNTANWTTTEPVDMTTVKAIAVDASMDKNGNPAVLEKNQNYRIEIIMRAPQDATAGEYAKNKATTSCMVNAALKVSSVGPTEVKMLNTYTVKYDLNGGNIGGYTTTPDKENVEWDDTSLLPGSAVVRPGYTLDKWVVSVGAASGTPDATNTDAYSALAEDENTLSITLKALWTAKTNTGYKVEYYKQDSSGTYPTTPNYTENKTGTTNTAASWSLTAMGFDASGCVFDKSTYQTSAQSTAVSITHPATVAIAGDGTLVYRVYYKIMANSVSYSYTGTIPTGAPTVPTTVDDVASGTEVDVAQAPTLAGYTFSGWETDDATVTGGKFNMPNKDVEFTGSWTAKSYTVTYDLDDGKLGGATTVANKTGVKWNDASLLPSGTPTKSGFTFEGWKYNTTTATAASKYSALAENDTTMSIELVAQWTEKSYTVTYDLDDGKLGGATTVASKTGVKWNDSSLLPSGTPTKDGFTFAGWNYNTTAVTGSSKYSDLAENDTVMRIELVAQWTAKSYTVTYDLDDGKIGEATTVANKTGVEWNDASLLPSGTPTKDGFTFAGWKYNTATATAASKYSDLAENDTTMSIELVAQWTEKGYTVTYDLDDGELGGATTVANKTGVKWNDASLLPSGTPTKSGFTFAGWKYNTTTATAASKYSDLAENDTTMSIELVAQWTEKNYTVTYDLDDGKLGGATTVASKTGVKWNDTSLLPSGTPTKDGATFIGWFYNTTEVAAATAYSALAANDSVMTIELKAKWRTNATLTDSSSGMSEITKTLTGTDPAATNVLTFKFNIAAGTVEGAPGGYTDVPMPATTQYNITTGAGQLVVGTPKSVSIGGISYVQPGTYTYTISEVAGTAIGVTYDLSQYVMTVVVQANSDNTALSIASVSFKKTVDADGNDIATPTAATAPAFENDYTPTDANPFAVASVNKTITGTLPSTSTPQTFNFTIEAKSTTAAGLTTATMPLPQEGGADNTTASTTGAGTDSFGSITFTKAGTYIYTIKEDTATPITGYIFDPVEYTLTVTVEDNAGKLTSSSEYTAKRTQVTDADGVELLPAITEGTVASSVSFSNLYIPVSTNPALMVDPPVRKALIGTPSAAAEFSFKLAATSTTATAVTVSTMPMPAGSTGSEKIMTILGAGSEDFGTWEYDVPGTYVYTVSEVNTAAANYTYDTTLYTITDVVTDVAGQLILNRSVTDPTGGPVTEYVFTNTYTAPPEPPVSPKTDDNTNLALWIVLMAVAAVGGTATVVGAKKRRSKNAK